MNKTVKVKLKNQPHQYEIKIGNKFLAQCGDWAKSVLPSLTKKIGIISNKKVFSLYGETVQKSLLNAGFDVSVHLIGDGERFKNLKTLERVLHFLSANKLTRTDAVVALGGGVVGDLTGFAASVYLRGINLLQIPTTLLSMIDSSVGGKTAVNSSFGKNLIGTFYQPNGVLIDVSTIQTLEKRELTAGFCEAVKQGAIADFELFNLTAQFLKQFSPKYYQFSFDKPILSNSLIELIARQVAFKARIVQGDERENVESVGAKSRKVLNFGHTIGHALEKITNYKYFKHGEAVGIGMLIAGEISKDVANFVQNELNLLNDVVSLTGYLPNCQQINVKDLIDAFQFDKKNVGNDLQWILLQKIGQPVIFSNRQIPISVIDRSIKKILTKKPLIL